jgi:RNA polymerase sigma factor (sigma-70 family)
VGRRPDNKVLKFLECIPYSVDTYDRKTTIWSNDSTTTFFFQDQTKGGSGASLLAGTLRHSNGRAVEEDKLIVESFLLNRTEETFFAVYEIFCVRIRRYFVLRGLDVQTAEDLTQEVLFKVYQKADELRDAESFCGWLYAIARNSFISHWRRMQSRVEGAEHIPLTPDLAEKLQIEAEALVKLRLTQLLEELSLVERDLVVLRYVEGLSYEDLAVALDIPLGTVKWRIYEVRRKLLQIMGAAGGDKPREMTGSS